MTPFLFGLGSISIRAPLAGSDALSMRSFAPPQNSFQSALPLRGATVCADALAFSASISIRAPLAGSDHDGSFLFELNSISIRAPLAGSDRYIL